MMAVNAKYTPLLGQQADGGGINFDCIRPSIGRHRGDFLGEESPRIMGRFWGSLWGQRKVLATSKKIPWEVKRLANGGYVLWTVQCTGEMEDI